MKIKTRKRGEFWLVILGDREFITPSSEVARWFATTFEAKASVKPAAKDESLIILFDRIATRANKLEREVMG